MKKKDYDYLGLFGPIFYQFVGKPSEALSPWLLTAFEKKNSVPDNTMDTDETHRGERNDTATPQDTVSIRKYNMKKH